MADETFDIEIDVDLRDLKAAAKAVRRFENNLKKVRRETQRLSKATRMSTLRTRNMGRQVTRLGRATQLSANRTAILNARLAASARANRPMARLAKTATSMAGGFVRAGKAVALFGGLAATATGLSIVKFAQGVIKAQEFLQTSELAFKLLTGSAAGGADAMGRVNRVADDLGLRIEDVASGFKGLLAAQFSIEDAETFTKLGADLKAIGADSEDVKRALRAISQVKAKGRLQSEELLQLSEAKLSRALVFKALRKQLDITQQELDKLFLKGAISADEGLKAIQSAILDKTNTTAAGQAAAQAAAISFDAIGVRIRNSITRLFQRVAKDSPKAFEKFRAIGKDIVRFFDEFKGDDLVRIFDLAITSMGALVKIGKAFISGFVGKLGAESENVGEFFEAFAAPDNLQRIQNFGKSISSLAANTARLATVMSQAVLLVTELADALGLLDQKVEGDFAFIGSRIMTALTGGIVAGTPGVIAASDAAAQASADAFRGSLGIFSPSRVFEGFGTDVVAGFNKGIEAPSMAAAASGAAAGQQITSGATTNNITLGGLSMNNEFNGSQDAEQTAAEVGRQVIAIIGRGFENMALQSGVA